MDHFYIYDIKFPMSKIALPQFKVGQFQTFSKKTNVCNTFISTFQAMKICDFKKVKSDLTMVPRQFKKCTL